MAEFVSRNKAAEFSLEHLLSEEGRSGLLSVSQSTWMLAYSLVSFYGYWRSRYYKLDIDGNMVTLDDSEWEQVTDLVDLAIEELSMTGYDDLIAALDGLNQTLADFKACCQAQTAQIAQLNDGIANDGVISVGQPGDQFPTIQEYYDSKCSAANAIYDTLLGFVTDMDSSDIESITSGIFGGVVPVVSAKLATSGPVGWAIAKVSSFVTSIAFTLISAVVDFSDIASALDDQHDGLVNALYNANNTVTAKSNFLTVLDQAATSLTDTERGLVADLLTNDLLNQLFEPRSDTVNYQSGDPVDCGSGGTVWTFDTGPQSWQFRDDSDGTASASGQHVPAREAWELSMDPDGGTAWGVIYLSGLSIAVDVGNSVQYDFSAPSDSNPSSIDLKVIYDDLSEFLVYGDYTAGGSMILSITEPGTIETIECFIGRQDGGGAYTQDIEEVRVQ